ncbi:MAG: hypothetical protein RLZZ488_2113 [Pseudomonadota bacterium]
MRNLEIVDCGALRKVGNNLPERGFGDCKDFALLLVKMARQLGYRADVALIHRGEPEFDPTSLAMPRHFNHMLTRIVDENGKTHWIDPTNTLHDATHVNRDIADHPALIVSETTRELARTPAELPEMNVLRLESDFEFLGEDNLLMNTSIQGSGEYARELIRSVSRKSESQRRDFILRIFSADRPLIKGELSMDELPKNLLRPFEMKARVEM